MRGNYYNEFDPFAAAWLRELIKAGEIAPGDVDERSITEVSPDDLSGYTQCHFFAGIGGWPYATRLARWADDRPIWTGSCPCQPFSVAGKGGGTDDARHLWPDFFRLIHACRPPVVMGEQVAGKAGYGWLDGVLSDLAGEGYAGRGVDIPACAVDAPHIRSRLYWVARSGDMANGDAAGRDQGAGGLAERDEGVDQVDSSGQRRGEGRAEPELRRGGSAPTCADASGVALGDADCQGLALRPLAEIGRGDVRREGSTTLAADERDGRHGNLADADGTLGRLGDEQPSGQQPIDEQDPGTGLWPGSRNGTFWSGADWLACHDGKARRTQPGSPLLAHGVPKRVAKWRGFGNAIVPQLAAEVIGALMDADEVSA